MSERMLPDRLAVDGLARLWAQAWKAMARAGPGKWESVRIRVPIRNDDERRAVGGLRGMPVGAGTSAVGLDLGALDRVVRQAGDGWDLRAAVEAAQGQPLPDRAAAAAARRDAIDAAVDAARAAAPPEAWFDEWLGRLAADGTLARLAGRGELASVATAASLLATLPAGGLPLPVVAIQVAGDTKALSAGTLPFLVLRGIAHRLGEPRPATAADRRALWEAVGVVPDDLASQVLVLNLPVRGRGLGEWLRDARRDGVPFRVTLHQLTRSQLEVVESADVFVCENPAVLRAATEYLGAGAAPVVCTEGRPSVACTRLLDVLGDGRCTLRYHGDFDWPGLRIGAAVLDRPAARPWRFGAADYLAPAARGRQPLRGAPATSPWDPALAEAMAAAGVAVFEEDVLESLLADLGA